MENNHLLNSCADIIKGIGELNKSIEDNRAYTRQLKIDYKFRSKQVNELTTKIEELKESHSKEKKDLIRQIEELKGYPESDYDYDHASIFEEEKVA